MAKQSINIGSGPNTKNGDPIREAFRKTDENFTDLYNNASISIVNLKILVAASTDFADFKARIAAL